MQNLKSKLKDLKALVASISDSNKYVDTQMDEEIKGFLCYITASDSNVAQAETDFINELLDTDFSSRDLANYITANQTFGTSFSTKIPGLLSIFLENASGNDYGEYKFCEKYIRVFEEAGKKIIIADEKADEKEVDSYNEYMNNLYDAYNKAFPNTPISINPLDMDNNGKLSETEDDPATLEELLQELDSLIGLNSVKRNVYSLIHLQHIQSEREKRGLAKIPMTNHLVFTGNPGTGKTTVARLIGRIYRKIGILSSGKFVEVDRSGMVAGYVGQTAIEVKNVVDEAMGGILFIDEAYSLSKGLPGDYGHEAIETLLKRMEDNRQDIVVIVAGYPKLMEQFISSNPGLRSRFSKKIHFPDYTPDELVQILSHMVKKNGFSITEDALDYAFAFFTNKYKNRGEDFANAREVRNFFESGVVTQADRLFGKVGLSDEDLTTLIADDFRFNELMIEE